VKARYGAWLTTAERDAMRRVLAACPDQTTPSADPPATPPAPAPVPSPPPGPATRYANCTAARAAGVTPILRGTPLYDANTHLDRDRDGVACE
jgi:hypothetical protein